MMDSDAFLPRFPMIHHTGPPSVMTSMSKQLYYNDGVVAEVAKL